MMKYPFKILNSQKGLYFLELSIPAGIGVALIALLIYLAIPPDYFAERVNSKELLSATQNPQIYYNNNKNSYIKTTGRVINKGFFTENELVTTTDVTIAPVISASPNTSPGIAVVPTTETTSATVRKIFIEITDGQNPEKKIRCIMSAKDKNSLYNADELTENAEVLITGKIIAVTSKMIVLDDCKLKPNYKF